MDNYYQNCPAKMGIDRGLTDFRSPTVVNESVKNNNDIVDNNDYRLFLQMNGTKIMDSQWLNLRKNQSCWNNSCTHKYPLRMNPRDFAQERERTNMVFTSVELPDELQCKYHPDYRMVNTPLQKYKIPYSTCNTCK